MTSGIVRAARAALGLSQAEFGAWLAEQLGRDAPIPFQRINEWEHGRRSPRRNIRRACLPVVADAIAADALKRLRSGADPAVVTAMIRDRIMEDTS